MGWQGLASALGTQARQTVRRRLFPNDSKSEQEPDLCRHVGRSGSLIRLFALASPQIASCVCEDFSFASVLESSLRSSLVGLLAPSQLYPAEAGSHWLTLPRGGHGF